MNNDLNTEILPWLLVICLAFYLTTIILENRPKSSSDLSVAEKETLIAASTVFFKSLGYRKKYNTWTRVSEDLISGFNIQTSRWDTNDYYINVGIVLIGIDSEPQTSYWQWHIQNRISPRGKSTDEILKECNIWLEKHSNINYLRSLAKLDYHIRLPVLMTGKAIDFLIK